MATREILPSSPSSCLCGWAMREALAFANGRTADDYTFLDDFEDPREELPLRYGGTRNEWGAIYLGICMFDTRSDIETAFAIRVAECVR
jgi:hypothetical protein